MLGAIEDGLLHLLAHGQIALDVFDLHRRVIHQDSNCKRQPSQGHDVDGLAERAEQNHGNENGQRDRDRNDQGWTPIAQKEQDHGRSKAGGDQAFPDDSGNRCSHEKRLIEQSIDTEFRRERLRRQRYHRLHCIDNRQGGRSAQFEDRHQHAAHAVLPHDVGLRRKSITHVRHIAQVECGRVRSLHREIVQFGDGLRSAVHLHRVFGRPDLGCARGQNQVLGSHRVDDVRGRQTILLQLGGIEVYLHLARLSAVRIGGARALNGGQLGAKKILSQIEQLLFGKRLAA